jgi:hypothetical protein
VTAVAPTLAVARANAYTALEPISWDGMLVRRDIAAAAAGVAGVAGAAGAAVAADAVAGAAAENREELVR